MSIRYMRLFFEAWSPCAEIQHLSSVESHYLTSNEFGSAQNRQLPTAEIRPMPLGDLDKDDIAAFFSIGFTYHREIIRFCKDFVERLYYIRECAKGMWSVEQLLQHLCADDYHHIGVLPNNFEKTLSPMAQATRAVRSFRNEYLLELINLDNVDARGDQDVDERVLSKTLVADVEKTIQACHGERTCRIRFEAEKEVRAPQNFKRGQTMTFQFQRRPLRIRLRAGFLV